MEPGFFPVHCLYSIRQETRLLLRPFPLFNTAGNPDSSPPIASIQYGWEPGFFPRPLPLLNTAGNPASSPSIASAQYGWEPGFFSVHCLCSIRLGTRLLPLHCLYSIRLGTRLLPSSIASAQYGWEPGFFSVHCLCSIRLGTRLLLRPLPLLNTAGNPASSPSIAHLHFDRVAP